MPKRLPSLNALRSFEAAARHLSFSEAASELSVTPAAVGFHIKRLEDDLGSPLFVRKHRQVELTQDGAQLASDLSLAFDQIVSAWQGLGAEVPVPDLVVTAPEFAVASFLMPAVREASSQSPGPRVSWNVSSRVLNNEEGWDVAIRYAIDPDPDKFCEPLLRPWFSPLAKPEVARYIRRPRDLMHHGLINVELGLDTPIGTTAWRPYFEYFGLPEPNFAMTCSDSPTAMELAFDTDYVAMGFPFHKHIDSGKLVFPLKSGVMPLSQNWFVCAKGMEDTDEMIWLREAFHTRADAIRERSRSFVLFELDGRLRPN